MATLQYPILKTQHGKSIKPLSHAVSQTT